MKLLLLKKFRHITVLTSLHGVVVILYCTLCLQDAKHSGASVTVETCPHYLAFSADEVPDGDTRFKCAPPIRDGMNRENLWKALLVCYFFTLVLTS